MGLSKKDMARVLEVGAVVGVGVLVFQRMALGVHLDSSPAPSPVAGFAGISVLKPLCGVDDGLEQSLEMFAALPYPKYELVMGVESVQDPAFAVAKRVVVRHPGLARVVVKSRDVGLNPKVNQLAGLARAARHGILLISDSNTRPARGYLHELNTLFSDPRVGCVTNPVAGRGAQTLGAAMDSMHLAGVAGQVLGAKALGVDLGVGKSQAVRRTALASVGGFAAYGNVLAEDYLIARDVARAGWKVSVARTPVYNWGEKRDVSGFVDRYARWSTMQATAEGVVPALGAMMTNPIPMALGALMLGGSAPLVAGVVALKTALDVSTAKALGVAPLGAREVLSVPLKDVALGVAQLRGLFERTVSWRGKAPVAVGSGTRLTRVRSSR